MEYLVIVERGERNCSAYVPDLPGCVVTGKTFEETSKNIREAMLWHRSALRTILAALLAALLVAPSPAPCLDDATALYVSAVGTMTGLKEPPYIAYRLEGQSDMGMEIRLVRDNGVVWIRPAKGTAGTVWYVLHRRRDFANAIVDQNKEQYYSNRSFFDPTWYGAFHALHDGMFFWYQQTQTQPSPKGITTPAPSPSPENGPLSTIAFVRVMGPQVYVVRDAGETRCENGDAGRALQLTARTSPESHQLTNAIVDLQSTRFCMLRFTETNDNYRAALTTSISVEQHYGDVDGYWVQTDGVVYDDWPEAPFGTSRVSWRYRLLGMTFLDSIPDDVFVP